MKNNHLSPLQKFTAVFLVLLACHWVLLVLFPDGMQRTIFFREGQDFMADFFNVLRYIADRNPYFTEPTHEKIYLPLAYMILFPFTRFDNYSAMSLHDCWGSIPALISMVFFTLVSCFMFYFSLKALCEKYNVSKLILVPLLLSGFFIRAVERGNLIIISASCTMVFLAFYDDGNKFLRQLAVVMLALTAVLKVWPAMFGLLYIRKKMYREFFSAVLISILLGLLPFLFFEHGFENIPRILKNLAANSIAYGSVTRSIEPLFSMNHYIYHFLKVLGINTTVSYYIAAGGGMLVKILAVCALILSVFMKSEYMALTLSALGIIFLPANTGSYCGLYLFPAIITSFNGLGGGHKLHKLFYLLYLSPLQLGIMYKGQQLGTWLFIGSISALFMLMNLYSAIRRKPEKSL